MPKNQHKLHVINNYICRLWVRDPIGVRSGSVRGPLGIRSGSVRGPFGVRSESVRGPKQKTPMYYWSQSSARSRLVNKKLNKVIMADCVDTICCSYNLGAAITNHLLINW